MFKTLNFRRLWLRKLFKIHTFAFAITLGVYFVLAFFDPGLLSYDLRQKFRALADETVTITATVLGPPAQPVVTATPQCNQTTGTLRVDLDWGNDPNTYTYDIERDSLLLVSGLVNSAYSDTNVVPGTTYQYEVTANGPMGPGSATSVVVSVTTPASCDVTLAVPSVTIVSFGGRNVDSYDGKPRISNRRPVFSGTTSMGNATVLVTVGSNFIAEFSANANGYWEWKPPRGVTSGSHIFTVTATDPNDSTRQATASLRFDILKRDDDGKSAKKDDDASAIVPTDSPRAILLDFTLAIEDQESAVLQGERLHTVITIEALQQRYTHITVPIQYTITDEQRKTVFSEIRQAYLTEDAVMYETFFIPLYMMPGKYFLQAEILLDDTSVSRSASLTVKELALIRLSSGATLSYADITRNLGWIIFLSLFFLLLWLFLFMREFALYLQGDKGVTERDFMRAGYIRK